MTTTDANLLPQFNGRPVPWVTRWTKEIHPERYKYGASVGRDGQITVSYKDGKENRDGAGVLWQREGIMRGGEPDWANVNTYRQRSSMQKRKCQVCGTKIADRPIRWLMPPTGIELLPEGHEVGAITMQPPTCSDCIPLALDLCPHLKKNGYQILKVLDYEVWGIFGHVMVMTENGPTRIQTAVSYDTSRYNREFNLTQVMAQQAVVKLTNWVVEEDHT